MSSCGLLYVSLGFTAAASVAGVFNKGFMAANRGARAIGAGIIGGLGALAGGGNRSGFAMGAVQGVMSRFLNDELHEHSKSFDEFMKDRLVSGQVRDDIFSSLKGWTDGAVSFGKGLFNFGKQSYRHFGGDDRAKIEALVTSKAVAEGASLYASSETVRSHVDKQVVNAVSNNASAYNIGRLVGRVSAGIILAPLGAHAAAGDAMQSVQNGGDIVEGVILGH